MLAGDFPPKPPDFEMGRGARAPFPLYAPTPLAERMCALMVSVPVRGKEFP